MTQLLRTANDIVEAYRRRVAELGLTYATVDAISGLPDGYTSKLLAPVPMKTMSRKAIELLNGALGMGFVAIEDPDQIKRVEKRWVQRQRPNKRAPLSIPLSMPNEVPVTIAITPDLQRQLRDTEHMKSIGKKGGKRRLKTMGKRARQQAASHAARMRWARAASRA